jgi:inner membrane transporter RhtA
MKIINPISTYASSHPTLLVILSIASTQIGAAFSKSLFPEVGSAGMVFLRVGFSAISLLTLCRPKWAEQIQQNIKILISFGVVLALMNLSFYASIERIPIGIAVTIEFIGPLGLAAMRSKRWLDILWVVLAFLGLLLLTPVGGENLDSWGILFALIAACFWAMYILLSAQVGQAVPGIEGLCWAMMVGAIILAPVGIMSAGSALLQPRLLAIGFAVATLSSTIPYSLEMVALKSLPVNVFGILMSLEPMCAAIAGLVILGETLTLRSMVAIVLVSVAAAGTSKFRAAIS